MDGLIDNEIKIQWTLLTIEMEQMNSFVIVITTYVLLQTVLISWP